MNITEMSIVDAVVTNCNGAGTAKLLTLQVEYETTDDIGKFPTTKQYHFPIDFNTEINANQLIGKKLNITIG